MAEHGWAGGWRAFGAAAAAAALSVGILGVGGAPAVGQVGDGEGGGSGRGHGRLRIEVDPSTDLSASQAVTVTVTGAADRDLTVTVCDATIGPTSSIPDFLALCDRSSQSVPAGRRPYEVTHTVNGAFTTLDGTWVDCWEAPAGCEAAVVGGTYEDLPFASTPLEFGPRPLGIRLTGPDVVRPGDRLSVEVTGVRPEPVGVAVCAFTVLESRDVFGGPCGPTATVPAGEDPVDVDLVAIHHFEASDGSIVDCGPGFPPPCVVAVGNADGSAFAWGAVYYSLEPRLLVSPRDGLVDGQVVELVGDRIPPSYEGPPFWLFPSTGGWGVAQCAQDVVDDPTILGVFTHCALPPGGPLPVDDPAEPVSVPVQATMTAILGGTTDCTAPDAACVLVLTRVDASGQVEMHATEPLGFAIG